MNSCDKVYSLKKTLRKIAESQYGYFTRKQAINSGYVENNHHHHVVSGNWIKISKGLYRLPDYPDSMHAEFTKWCLWSRNQQEQPQGVISHKSALALHGYSAFDAKEIHMSVYGRFQKKIPHGIIIHSSHLTLSAIEARGCFMVTRLFQTLKDTKGELENNGQWNNVVEKVLNDGKLTGEETRELGLSEKYMPTKMATIGQSIFDAMSDGVWKMINQRSSEFRTRSRTGFTLIEMLVIIAIISILASLLLPALQKSLGCAKSLKCANNQKQVLMAQWQYVNDNYGWCWFAGYSNTKCDTWPLCLLGGYNYKQPEYIDNGDIFCCPSSSVTSYNNDTWKTYGMYKSTQDSQYNSKGYKFAVMPSGYYTFYNYTKIPSPSRFVMLADSADDTGTPNNQLVPTLKFNKTYAHLRHCGKANSGFVDGHVKSLDPTELRESATEIHYSTDENLNVLYFP